MKLLPSEAIAIDLHLSSILNTLRSFDSLHLPPASRDDVRIILVRRVARQIEANHLGHIGHGERTATYAQSLGESYGLLPTDLLDLHFAALLHDIGLTTVPSDIRSGERPLRTDEYALVQSHPRIGAELLHSIPFLRQAALLIAHHHDGMGMATPMDCGVSSFLWDHAS